MSDKVLSLDEPAFQKFQNELFEELKQLHEVNVTPSKTEDSLSAEAHGEKLRQLVDEARRHIVLYNYFVGKLSTDGRK